LARRPPHLRAGDGDVGHDERDERRRKPQHGPHPGPPPRRRAGRGAARLTLPAVVARPSHGTGTIGRPVDPEDDPTVSDYTAVRLRVPLRTRQPLPDTGAVLWNPVDDPGDTPVVVLGHGAGSDLTNPVLCAVGRGLALQGVPVLTFNFAYAEAGLKRPDPPARLLAAFGDAIALARERLGARRPLVTGGRSMGGRIATLLAAEGTPCDGLLLLGYPLHQAGRPERLRTDHWPALRAPLLFI